MAYYTQHIDKALAQAGIASPYLVDEVEEVEEKGGFMNGSVRLRCRVGLVYIDLGTMPLGEVRDRCGLVSYRPGEVPSAHYAQEREAFRKATPAVISLSALDELLARIDRLERRVSAIPGVGVYGLK